MVKASLKTSLYIGISLLLLGCAQPKKVISFDPMDLNPKIQSGEYVQRVDNLLIVMDVSRSMLQKYKGRIKLSHVKDIVSRLNQTIPDLELKTGLRGFGQGSFAGASTTALIVDLSKHDKTGITNALKNITNAGGDGLLNLALEAGCKDLETAQGDIAVIVIGNADEMDPSPLDAAEAMKREYGDRLCIYTVLIGDDPKGKVFMEDMAAAGGCGFSVMADDISTSGGMAGFVEKVFLAKARDADDDGVLETLDQCPDTPRDAKVDDWGCWVLKGVYFGMDKWELTPSSHPVLDEVVFVLKRNPDLKVEVQGHTDNVGDALYNRELSRKRARSVMDYFIRLGISPDRLSYEGYGFSDPVASNATPEGRAMNRRVELKPIY